ncbi:MAG: tetratricopeptide repeat protein, partial [Saprospiraceae bacterium]|nr:tetratricopeptide repeat protein [Saprospiraceae bacterium]
MQHYLILILLSFSSSYLIGQVDTVSTTVASHSTDSLNQLYNLGYQLFQEGRKREAVRVFRAIIDQATEENGREREIYLNILERLIQFYLSENRYARASRYTNRMLTLLDKHYTWKDPRYVPLLETAAVIYYKTRKYQKAEKICWELRTIKKQSPAKSINTDLVYTNALLGLARIYQAQEEFDRAEVAFEKVVLWSKLHNDSLHLESSIDLSILYLEIGQYTQAKTLLQNLKDTLEDSSYIIKQKELYQARTFVHLGYANFLLGHYTLVEPLYEQAQALLKMPYTNESNKNWRVYGKCYAQLLADWSAFYEKIGQYPKALNLQIQAVDVYTVSSGNYDLNYVQEINQLAKLYQLNGRSQQAYLLYEYTQDLIRGLRKDKHSVQAELYENLGLWYLAQDNKQKAEQYFRRSLRIARQSAKRRHISFAYYLNNLAMVVFEQQHYLEAENLLYKAQKLRKRTKTTQTLDYAIILKNLSLLYYTINRPKKAKQFFKKANEAFLYQVYTHYPNLSEAERLQFISTIQTYFDIYYDFATQRLLEDPSIAKDIQDIHLALKNLSLESSVEIKAAALLSQDTLLQQEYSNWMEARERLLQVQMMSKQERNRQKIKLDSLMDYTNQLERNFGRHSAVIQDEFNKRKQRIYSEDLKSLLKENEAYVDFFHFSHYTQFTADSTRAKVHYYALILHPNWEHPRCIPIGTENELKRLLNNRISPETSNYLTREAKNEALSQIIWQPVERYMAGIDRIHIASTGLLNKVAFSALCMEDCQSIVLDHYELVHHSSLRDWYWDEQAPRYKTSNQRISLFGGIWFDADSSSLASAIDSLQLNSQTQQTSVYRSAPQHMQEHFYYLPQTATEVQHIAQAFQKQNWEVQLYTQ